MNTEKLRQELRRYFFIFPLSILPLKSFLAPSINFKSRFGTGFKSIALALVLAFCFQEAAFSMEASYKPTTREFNIPKELASPSARLNGEKNSPFIIHIEDAHTSADIQFQISKILDYLVSHYDLRLISVEGASGVVDTSLLSAFPDKDLARRASENLVRDGLMSAAEFYSVVSEKKVLVAGAEEAELYEEDLGAFRKLLADKDKIITQLDGLYSGLDAASQRTYSPMLSQARSLKRQYSYSQLEFIDFWKQSERLAKKVGVDVKSYYNLSYLSRAIKLESRIDFKAAERERGRLLDRLTPKLERQKAQELIRHMLSYKRKEESGAVFHSYLFELASENGIQARGYQQLRRYHKYLLCYENVRMERVFFEIGDFEKELINKLAVTDSERKLVSLERRVEVFASLLQATMHGETFGSVEGSLEEYSAKAIEKDWSEILRRSGVGTAPSIDFEILKKSEAVARNFYILASKRNEALLQNTVSRMRGSKTRVAALVTGGFHSSGILKLAQSGRLSYLVLTPRFDASKGSRPYIAVLTKKPEAYKQTASYGASHLTAPLLFARTVLGGEYASSAQAQSVGLARFLFDAFLKDGAILDSDRKSDYWRAYQDAFVGEGLEDRGFSSYSPQQLKIILDSYSIELDGDDYILTYKDPEHRSKRVVHRFQKLSKEDASERIYEYIGSTTIQRRGDSSEDEMASYFAGLSLLTPFMVIHEMGHLIARWFLDNEIKDSFFSELFQIVSRGLSSGNFFVEAGDKKPWKIRLKAAAGPLANISSAILVSSVGAYFGTLAFIVIGTPFLAGSFAVLWTSRSDWYAVWSGKADNFYCGNIGVLAQREEVDGNSILPKRVQDIAETMGIHTEIRGEQAGGLSVYAKDREDGVVFVGDKIVNRKRYNLTRTLRGHYAKAEKAASSRGIYALGSLVMAFWHYRYGTSSSPSVLETHWHEWMSGRIAEVWVYSTAGWFKTLQNINNRITHNGDFDAFYIFGKNIDNATIGLWLERVLHTPNETRGDSPKIAGMMDLLITKGMWDASVRAAYQFGMAKSVEDAFGDGMPSKSAANTAPSPQDIHTWASVFKKVLEDRGGDLNTKKDRDIFVEDAVKGLINLSHFKGSSQDEVKAFAQKTINFFLYYDSYQATKFFLSRATGTFGLVVAATLDSEHLVVAAKGQPISIGYDYKRKFAVYASETAAVNAVLLSSGGEDAYRLDLDQKAGEVARIGLKDLAVYSMSDKKQLEKEDLAPRWIEMKDNPYINVPVNDSRVRDLVKRDIKDIPGVLAAIKRDWQDSLSFNRRSSQYFENLFINRIKEIQKSRKRSPRSTAPVDAVISQQPDILITGIEASQWLGERFAADLKRVFPGLNIEAVSANKLLTNPANLPVGPHTIVLAISQSGQTFPTLQATELLETLKQKNRIRELFVLTGELDSLMGNAIGQRYNKQALFGNRIFINGSGRRSAEPSTVAVAAAQETLTELLFRLAEKTRDEFPNEEPVGMKLTSHDIESLQLLRDAFISQNVPYVTGFNARGGSVVSQENEKLIQLGAQWSKHVTEPAVIWALTAAYVGLSVFFQMPLFGSVYYYLLSPFLNEMQWGQLFAVQSAHFLDAVLYVWFGWFTTLVYRWGQGRHIFARLGKRTVVIGDIPYVHQLLESYASKLFSLSYGHASIDVHGANPQDHMLHRFGHRVVRGVLVWIGLPDGRLSDTLRRKENASKMTGSQATGVGNISTSAEVFTVGANPSIVSKGFDENVILWSEEQSLLQGQPDLVIDLWENRFGSFERLLAGYVFFWSLTKKVSRFPFLEYDHWKSQSRTRIATTASPEAPAVLIEDEEVKGARLAITTRPKSLIKPILLAGFLLVGFPLQASAAVVREVGNGLLVLQAERGDTLWEIVRTLFKSEGKTHLSSSDMWGRIGEVASQNGIQNPDLIYAGKEYSFKAAETAKAAELFGGAPSEPVATPAPSEAPPVQPVNEIPVAEVVAPAPMPADISTPEPVSTHTEVNVGDAIPDTTTSTMDYISDDQFSFGDILDYLRDSFLSSAHSFINSMDTHLLWYAGAAGLAFLLGVIVLPWVIRKTANLFRKFFKSQEESAVSEAASSDSNLRILTDFPSGDIDDLFQEPLVDVDTAVTRGSVRVLSDFYTGPFVDEVVGADFAQDEVKGGIELVEARLKIGIYVASNQNKEEAASLWEKTLKNWVGDAQFERLDLSFYNSDKPENALREALAAGATLFLDDSALSGGTLVKKQFIQALAKMDNQVFEILQPFLAQLTRPTAKELSEQEAGIVRRVLEQHTPAIEKIDTEALAIFQQSLSDKQIVAELETTLQELRASLDEIQTASSNSQKTQMILAKASELSQKHGLRFYLADPSYEIALPDFAGHPGGEVKTIVTDLELFTKDGQGVPYSLRMQHLVKKTEGRFKQVLLVRDPSIPDTQTLFKIYPEAAVFGGEIIFAPNLKSVSELKDFVGEGIFDKSWIVLTDKEDALEAAQPTQEDPAPAYLLALDGGATSSIGILETAAQLVWNPDQLPQNVRRFIGSTSFVYIPPVAPVDYEEIVRTLEAMRPILQAA